MRSPCRRVQKLICLRHFSSWTDFDGSVIQLSPPISSAAAGSDKTFLNAKASGEDTGLVSDAKKRIGGRSTATLTPANLYLRSESQPLSDDSSLLRRRCSFKLHGDKSMTIKSLLATLVPG